MADVHEGDYGNHAVGRLLANKVLTVGYFWLQMHVDTKRCFNPYQADQSNHEYTLEKLL